MPQPKLPRKEAYKIFRKLSDIPCANESEIDVSKKLGALPTGKLVDQLQSFANKDMQKIEMQRRCRAARLQFYFDAGSLVQFKMMELENE